MPMFVSHIDESGKGSPLFISGGLTARAEQWLAFSDEWRRILDAPPRIPAFHLAERQGLTAAAHNRKIDSLIPVINAFAARGDLSVTFVEIYRRLYRNLFSATLDNVFHFSYVQIIQQCALHLPDPDGKIDFVFDYIDNTQYLELVKAFRDFREACPSEEVRRRFNSDPIRRHDHEVLPLQAADLWAGLMRRASFDHDAAAAERIKQFTIENRATLWDEERLLEHWSMQIARNPEILTGAFYEGPKDRSKKLKTLRSELLGTPSRNDR